MRETALHQTPLQCRCTFQRCNASQIMYPVHRCFRMSECFVSCELEDISRSNMSNCEQRRHPLRQNIFRSSQRISVWEQVLRRSSRGNPKGLQKIFSIPLICLDDLGFAALLLTFPIDLSKRKDLQLPPFALMPEGNQQRPKASVETSPMSRTSLFIFTANDQTCSRLYGAIHAATTRCIADERVAVRMKNIRNLG